MECFIYGLRWNQRTFASCLSCARAKGQCCSFIDFPSLQYAMRTMLGLAARRMMKVRAGLNRIKKWGTKQKWARSASAYRRARWVPYAEHGRWKSGDGTKGRRRPTHFILQPDEYGYSLRLFFYSLHSYEEWSSVCIARALDIYLRPFIIVTITSQELSFLSFFSWRFDTFPYRAPCSLAASLCMRRRQSSFTYK